MNGPESHKVQNPLHEAQGFHKALKIRAKHSPAGKLCLSCKGTGWDKTVIENGQQGLWATIQCGNCDGKGFHKRKTSGFVTASH